MQFITLFRLLFMNLPLKSNIRSYYVQLELRFDLNDVDNVLNVMVYQSATIHMEILAEARIRAYDHRERWRLVDLDF